MLLKWGFYNSIQNHMLFKKNWSLMIYKSIKISATKSCILSNLTHRTIFWEY